MMLDDRARSTFRVFPRVLGLVLLAGCATPVRPVQTPPVPDVSLQRVLSSFQQQIHDGCYLSLKDVVEQYATLDARIRQQPAVRRLAAKAALFFILRDKELGIPIGRTWAEANGLAAEEAGRSTTYRFDLDVARVLPWNDLGVGTDFAEAQRRLDPVPADRVLEGWRLRLTKGMVTDEVAAYLALSLNCEFPSSFPIHASAIRRQYLSEPLIQYRWATCAQGGDTAMTGLLQQDARFAEAHYLLGETAFDEHRFDRAQREYRQAWQGIPRFTAAGLAYADLALSAEEFVKSLHVYGVVLSIVPTHRKAMLSRVIALSYLGRYQEAANGASRLIALGSWYLGDAHYWRAFAEYHLNEMSAALVDVEAAKHYLNESRVPVLAGLIRMGDKNWPEATEEFHAALHLNPGRCDAMFYLGQVYGMRDKWPDAADSFARSAACFLASQQATEHEIAKLKTETGGYAARMLARRRAELRQTVGQKASALFNAAVSYATAGDRHRAMTYAAQAAAFPAYAGRLKKLIVRIQPR